MYFRFSAIVLISVLLAAVSAGQEIYTPLATMNGRSFTVQDLPSDVGGAWQKMPTTLIKARKDLLELQIDRLLLLQEANKRAMDVDTLIDLEVNKKVPDPDEKEIKELYDANSASLGDTPLSEIKSQIVSYLRLEPEKTAREAFAKKLRESAKIEYVKDVNEKELSLNDVLAKVNEEPVTVAMYKRKNGLALYEYEANVFDQLDAALRMIVDAAVYQTEAQSLGIPVNELIAREVTSKMKEYSTAQHQKLEKELKDRLYSKYRVMYFVEEPKPYVQFVSADDDPFIGKENAKVTIVMFSDYECPACAGVHPLIKDLQTSYGDRVRLVYRDFPLMKVHENAMPAARAAYAARKQGKFFEYTELLFENQTKLDLVSLKKYAEALGLDAAAFTADMNSPEAEAEIKNDIADGGKYGVTGTPSIFVNGYKIRTLSIYAFKDAIERALAGTL